MTQIPISSNEESLCLPVKEGWVGRFFGSEPRLTEIVELYTELGFEVVVEKLDIDSCNGCTDCFTDGENSVKAVYTKEKFE